MEEKFIELTKETQNIVEVAIEYLPDTSQFKNIGRRALKRINPIINMCDSYEEYKKTGKSRML